MAQIQLDPQVVRSTGTDIKRKKDDLEQIINRAKHIMDSLRDNFKGRRSTAIYSEWEQIYPTLSKSFDNLLKAGQLLESAAADFESADNAGPSH
jgi:WXG100 family type VII secretion target